MNGTTIDLTPRQHAVARLVARGYGTVDVARELGISTQATKMHINAIADRLENPSLLTPLRLVRRWAIQQPWLRESA